MEEEEGKVFSAEGGEIGYDSFLRPMKMMRNQSQRRGGDSNSQENLQGSFGPAETGSNYNGFSDNLVLDEEVDPKS